MRPAAAVKAGHRRAYTYLSEHIVRWRCPTCLEDIRRPPVRADGVHCPRCGTVDARRAVVLDAVPSRAGFWWRARFADPIADNTQHV